jgi:uncharacterized repeat protein (TIGR01451 family)
MERNALSTRSVRKTAAAVGLAATLLTLLASSQANAVEGPVILGGDNFPNHGQFNAVTNVLEDGWLAMQREIAWVAPKVGRVNDGTVAAIGARQSAAIGDGDAGAAIGRAVTAAGLTTTYHDGANAINAFFADLAAGTAQPRVIWLAGNQANNALDASELAVLTTHASALATFVSGGGGLISHGDASVYDGWLPLVAPGLTPTSAFGIGVSLTPAGATALPGVSPAQLSVGSWRNAFGGALDNLEVLVQSNDVFEPDGITRKTVVVGGGRAWSSLAPADLRVQVTAPPQVDRGDVVPYTIAVTNLGPNLAPGTVVTHTLPRKIAFGGATAGPGRTCAAGPPVTCTLGMIAVGATVNVVVNGKVRGGGATAATTGVTAQVPDAAPADNTATTAIRSFLTNLRVEVVTPEKAKERTEMLVRVRVTNTGKRIAKKVVVRSPIPADFTLEKRPPQGRAEANSAVWTIGNIRPGRTKLVTMRLRIATRISGKRCLIARAQAANAIRRQDRSCSLIRLR